MDNNGAAKDDSVESFDKKNDNDDDEDIDMDINSDANGDTRKDTSDNNNNKIITMTETTLQPVTQ